MPNGVFTLKLFTPLPFANSDDLDGNPAAEIPDLDVLEELGDEINVTDAELAEARAIGILLLPCESHFLELTYLGGRFPECQSENG